MNRHRTKGPWVLGISGSHNGSFCLLQGDRIHVAIQEERLVGLKRARVYGGRHSLGLRYCLDAAGIEVSDLSMVVLASQSAAGHEENDLGLNPDFRELGGVPKRVVSHHRAHATSVFATSGYEHAAVLVVDGMGSPVVDLDEDGCRATLDHQADFSEHLSLFHARGTLLEPREVQASQRWIERVPSGMWRFHSLGGLFSAVAHQIFGESSEAGKVMGLAPYGEPVIGVEEFLSFDGQRICFPNRVQERFPGSERWPEREKEYRDLACSAQRALEIALLRVARHLRVLTGEDRLCMAGGVALNSVANQVLCEQAGFEHVYIIPAAEDSGVAVGAAFLGLWELGHHPSPRQIRTDFHGRTATEDDIELATRRAPRVIVDRPADLLDAVASRLEQNQIGGWLQGGSELGPRALGHRSILCSPCRNEAKRDLNARVKYREEFRPFAPSVLADHATDWFDFGKTSPDSPFMLRVIPFHPAAMDRVPAVVHVDGTGRVQTITREDDGLYHDLVARFHARTGIPLLLNTSMNVQGEPIVETPEDALWCFLGTGLDFCVLHDRLITKAPSFRTVLDFIPAVVAEEYWLRLPVESNALQRSLQREDAVTVRVQTPWGKMDTMLPLRLLPLLSRIDGRRDGHVLQRLLASTAHDTQRDLLVLRRMHMIELHDVHY